MSYKNHLITVDASIWQKIEWQPSKMQIQQLVKLQELLELWNKKLNLTRLINGQDYWIAQVLDSLWPLQNELKFPNKPLNCIDVGSGCGFPGIAVAIAMPRTKVTLVDSAIKKTAALKDIATKLELSSRVSVRAERIETTGQNLLFRQNFDLAMARAVAPANVLAEYLIPLVKPKGDALIYKGHWSMQEEKSLQNALVPLNSTIKSKRKLELPSNRGIRHAIRLSPNGNCPSKYPRSIGKPCKKPLGI